MKPCQMAGKQCPRQADRTARIAGVGDRAVCQADFDWMVSMGMNVRALEPNAFVPEWRTRDLGRDQTGRVLVVGR
jgi:hypothetical protein